MRPVHFLPLLLGLAGCVAAIPPVQVTRFHIAGAPAAGPVAVEAGDKMSGDSLEFRTYAAAVQRELVRQGYGTQGPAVYRVTVQQTQSQRAVTAQSPVSIGLGGAVELGLRPDLGMGGSNRIWIHTRLAVQMKRAADGVVVWEGRAETEAQQNAPASQPGLAADKLARALFQGFPGESGRTITVP